MCTILKTVHRNQVAAQMQASEFQKIWPLVLQENKSHVSVWSMLLVCDDGGASSCFRYKLCSTQRHSRDQISLFLN